MRKLCNSAAEEGINSNGVSLKVWKEATVKEQDKKAEVYMTEDELDALYDMPLLGNKPRLGICSFLATSHVRELVITGI